MTCRMVMQNNALTANIIVICMLISNQLVRN